jgi:hypothetical protein
MNGVRAPVLGTALVNGQEQINFQVPNELAGASRATLTITANGATSAPVEVPLVAAQPEIFAVTRSGDSITLWATGLGAVVNAPSSGQPAPASPLARTIADATVTVNGSNAPVTYSGLAPGYVGLYQTNASVPVGASLDEIVLRVGSAVSRPWRAGAR